MLFSKLMMRSIEVRVEVVFLLNLTSMADSGKSAASVGT